MCPKEGTYLANRQGNSFLGLFPWEHTHFRVWREHRGLTVRQLADQAGVSAPFVSQIETGQREGSVETMRKIAGVLKISLDDLV